MNQELFASIADEWFGPLHQVAATVGAPVARRVGQDPTRIHIVQLNYKAPGSAPDTQPPEQAWCAYAHRDGTAFVISAPKAPGLWSIPDNVYVMLATYTHLLLRDEPGFTSKESETADAFAVVIGPYEFVQSTALEWINAPRFPA